MNEGPSYSWSCIMMLNYKNSYHQHSNVALESNNLNSMDSNKPYFWYANVLMNVYIAVRISPFYSQLRKEVRLYSLSKKSFPVTRKRTFLQRPKFNGNVRRLCIVYTRVTQVMRT